jgi:alpha-mannosidase
MAKPLYYTFGNHMHWVDMTWLWGHAVLPSSVRDMLRLIESTGVRGNVNFDGVGYEKLAAESPQALAELREAVRAGKVEIVGASYGQPYGLFHGGESNVRQRVLGVRAVLRQFGVRPRAFWEEEFDFFPQLPQILRGCGFECAALFFQWTWHTPSIPLEEVPLVTWEGLDGSRLPALARTELCLHQWPEDFDGRLDSERMRALATPALVQWLELLPSPDWMCRSELLLPRLRELAADPRFELRPATLSELVAALARAGEPPVRRYGLDDVFHGLSLGKNGDFVPRYSRSCEEQLLAAESLAALAGLFGRPYAGWDVYPTWELDEAWRELCVAQHHDVHECEGLCGSIGERSFERAANLAEAVYARTLDHVARRVDALEGSVLVHNPLGWTRDVAYEGGLARDVPAFGYTVIDPFEGEEGALGSTEMEFEEDTVSLVRGDLRVTIDRKRGLVTQLRSKEFPDGCLAPGAPLGLLRMTRDARTEAFTQVSFDSDAAEENEFAEFVFERRGRGESELRVTYSLSPTHDALSIHFGCEALERPDPGMHPGLQTIFAPALADPQLLHDHPFGITAVRADKNYVRKYPTGDWMTSPQVFEDVRRPFTAASLVDLLEGARGERGLLLVHDGSQAFFRDERGVRALLNLYDPWDEEHWKDAFEAEFWLLPHGALTHAQRMRTSMELNLGSPRFENTIEVPGGGDLPPTFGAVHVEAPGVLATALYRESEASAPDLERAFARGARGAGGVQGSPGVRDPFVLRLVEFDGNSAEVRVRVPGPVARAARTNLLGEVEQELAVEPAQAPWGPSNLPWSALHLTVRAHEIVTIMLDLELGRAQPRNLDEYRHVWATVHRRAEARA